MELRNLYLDLRTWRAESVGLSLRTWWIKEAFTFVPAPIMEWLTGKSQKVVVVAPAEACIHIELVHKGGKVLAVEREPHAAFSMASVRRFITAHKLDRFGVEIGVLLPFDQVFRRNIKLPIEATRETERVAKNDLVTKTPFTVDNIYVGLGQKSMIDRQTVVVSQYVVLRRIARDAAAKLGLSFEHISFIVVADGSLHDGRLYISTISDVGQESGVHYRIMSAIFGMSLLLFVIAIAGVYYHQERVLEVLSGKIAVAQIKKKRVQEIVDKIEQRRGMLAHLREKKYAEPVFLDIWEEATRVLPAHTWLTELRLSRGPNDDIQLVTMIGFSAAASTLVGLVNHSPLFTEASLTAPIVVDAMQARERFSMQAKLRRHNAKATEGGND